MRPTSPLPPRTLLTVGWRYLLRQPWQSLLMVLGITLGVAVAVGIDIANASASRAFELGTETVAGKATHYIGGGPGGLDESVYADLRRAGVVEAAAPIISTYVTSERLGGAPLQLLGVDPFAEPPFRDYFGGEEVPVAQLARFLVQPGAVLLSADLAEQYGLEIEDSFSLEVEGYGRTAVVAGLLRPDDDLSRRALSGVLLADISTAQELTGRLGVIDRIDLILPDPPDAAIKRIQPVLPEGLNVLPMEGRSAAAEQFTDAFQTNLTALSLLALIVGLFLIYNTMTFSVVQRRAMFGTLRCLGVTRRELFAVVEGEALLVGAIGALLGMGLGVLLGRGAVELVSRTINDVLFAVTVKDVAVSAGSLVKGAVLGIVATVLAAAMPAWEAASVPPREALARVSLESKTNRVLAWVTLGGFLLTVAGAALLAIPTRNLVVSFGGTFAVVIGFALLTPFVTRFLMRLAAWGMGRVAGVLGRMAPRQVVNAISRTSVAVAALMVAVAVTIGVSLMVSSFRSTVEAWMNQVLSGDIYISVPGATVSELSTPIDPAALEVIEGWPGVAEVDLLRSVDVDSPFGPVNVSANNNPNDGEEQIYIAADGSPKEVWAQVQDGAVIVSEILAARLDIPHHGGQIQLYTDSGLETFPVVAVYSDFASNQGSLIMWLKVYRQHWDDEAVTAVGLRLQPGADVDAVAAGLQTALLDYQNLLVQPNQALRASTLEIFDQTFAITGALQLLTTIVAFIGVLSAMLSLQLEKQRQLGILKAVGLTGRQLWGLVMLETGLMGGVAGLLAMPTGYVVSLILTYVINRRAFGWTLELQMKPEPFLSALALSLAAALLAGVYPAYRLGKQAAAEAMRFD